MCNLCAGTEEERVAARRNNIFQAKQMEALAKAYRDMASGMLNPHGDEAKKVGNVARSLVRELVAEWV